jgi:hypothetical protein
MVKTVSKDWNCVAGHADEDAKIVPGAASGQMIVVQSDKPPL